MNKIHRILVIVDPSVDRDFVIDRTKLIAESSKAEIRLFINNSNSLEEEPYLYEGMHKDFISIQKKLFVQHNVEILEEFVEEFSALGLAVSMEFREEHNLAEAILKQANEFQPDLLIKSTHKHNLIERSVLSNTDWRLVRKSPFPLLLVKSEPWHKGGSVVAAVDPLHRNSEESNLDHKLLSTIEFLSKQLSLSAHVFHAYLPLLSSFIPEIEGTQEFLLGIKKRHEKILMDFLEGHTIEPTNIKICKGELVPGLTEYIEASATNILVIGALSRNILERAIIGDTAEQILEGCPCDVLVLKS